MKIRIIRYPGESVVPVLSGLSHVIHSSNPGSERRLQVSTDAIESVTYKITWVQDLRGLSYCCHGNHQGHMHRFPHQPTSLLRVDSRIYRLFPIKTTWVLDSCYFTTSDLNRSSQKLKKTHSHMSHVRFFQYYVGIYKNNTNPKITLAYKSRWKYVSELHLYQKIRYLPIILGQK
jgi:hypothetical protein